MSNCGYKIKNTCTKTYAPCVVYEGYLPTWSGYLEEQCVTIEETTEEIYKKIDYILDDIDLTALGSSCITYQKEGDKLKVKEVLLEFENRFCSLSTNISSTVDFTNCNLDYGSLLDQCSTTNRPTTQCEFNQYILDQLNILKDG